MLGRKKPETEESTPCFCFPILGRKEVSAEELKRIKVFCRITHCVTVTGRIESLPLRTCSNCMICASSPSSLVASPLRSVTTTALW